MHAVVEETYFHSHYYNSSNRNPHSERFPFAPLLLCGVTMRCFPSSVCSVCCPCSVWSSCLTVSLSLRLFQCMRNPALLQRTGLVIRVLCHIQQNVWLLRWMCRCGRHHGQLLGGKEDTGGASVWMSGGNLQHNPSHTHPPPPSPRLVLIWLLKSGRVPNETMKMRLLVLKLLEGAFWGWLTDTRYKKLGVLQTLRQENPSCSYISLFSFFMLKI